MRRLHPPPPPHTPRMRPPTVTIDSALEPAIGQSRDAGRDRRTRQGSYPGEEVVGASPGGWSTPASTSALMSSLLM